LTGSLPAPNIARVTSVTLPSAVLEFDEPTGIAPRGTLVVLTGRGETPAVYGRFGRRLSADAYRVRVVETRLDDLEATRAAVATALVDAVAPRVLVGSDAGATVATRLADDFDALILAGLPSGEGAAADELEARTACPAHRAVLAEHGVPGQLGAALPAPGAPTVPTLVIHGDADPIASPPTGFNRVVLVSEGRHDILNDVTHRSVAATIVLFLERLRLGAGLPAIVRDA